MACHICIHTIYIWEMFTQLNILWIRHSVSFLLHVMTLPYKMFECVQCTSYTHIHTKLCSNFASPECALWICQFSSTTSTGCMCMDGVSFFLLILLPRRENAIWTQTTIQKPKHIRFKGKKQTGQLTKITTTIHCSNLWTCNIYWHSDLVFIFRNISTWSFQCDLNIGIMRWTLPNVLREHQIYFDSHYPTLSELKSQRWNFWLRTRKQNILACSASRKSFQKCTYAWHTLTVGVVCEVSNVHLPANVEINACTEVLLLIQRKWHV